MKRILVVDDEESIRFTFDAFLQAAGYETILAEDGPQGLACCMNTACDLAVMDLILPNKSGIGLLEEIRRNELPIPVILITGRPSRLSLERAVALGASDYLIKPVRKSQLLDSVSKALTSPLPLTSQVSDRGNGTQRKTRTTPAPSPALQELLLSAKLRY